jgi:hypothetical protein
MRGLSYLARHTLRLNHNAAREEHKIKHSRASALAQLIILGAIIVTGIVGAMYFIGLLF